MHSQHQAWLEAQERAARKRAENRLRHGRPVAYGENISNLARQKGALSRRGKRMKVSLPEITSLKD
jgi:hypothetical protein